MGPVYGQSHTVKEARTGRSGLEGTERVAPGAGPSEPHLLIVAVDGTWTSRPLPAEGVLTIGRDAGADIRIDEKAVSRRHARLEVTAGGLRLVDLGSSNGTIVGGEVVRGASAAVPPGASILVGRTVIAVHAPPRVPEVRPAQPAGAPGADALIAKVAPTSINVLLLGETGVGKDVAAERIHRLSARAPGPLLRLNCAALSPALLESELFGHEKGAFTGADHARPGLLEAAAGGTVFLDEVGEMPLEVQAKLLLAIEQRVARRVGATASRPVDVRFVSATNRDLEAEIRAGRFRADFYHRINGVPIRIPPLRERRGEIDGLVARFAGEAAAQLGRGRAPAFDADAIACLHRYDWPGNIRQLRNVVERAVLFAEDDVVTPRVLELAELPAAAAAVAAAPSPQAPPPRPAPVAAPMSRDGDGDDDGERARVIAALAECGGNQTRAAKKLGIARNTLRARIKKYDLPCPHEQDPA